MHGAVSLTDLAARAEGLIRASLAGGRTLALADFRRSWPVTRPLLRAVADEMLHEGRLVRIPSGDRGGPPRYALPLP